MIRARLPDGTLTTYIGPDPDDPNGGHVIRYDNGNMHTVHQFTPELANLKTPQWLTTIYQGPQDGIATWPTPEARDAYIGGQLRSYGRLVAIGQLITHNGLYVIADSTGTPLRADHDG